MIKKVTILPIGSTEYHGGHLPLETDWLIAKALSERIKEQLTDSIKVFLLPIIKKAPLSASKLSPGSVYETPQKLIKNILKAAKNCNTDKLFLLSGHWGGTMKSTLTLAALEVYNKYKIDVYIVDIFSAIPLDKMEQRYFGHADELETSMILYLHPEKVKAIYKKHKFIPPQKKTKHIHYLFAKDSEWHISYWGEPALATKKKGEIIVKTMVESLANAIQECTK